MSDGLPKIHPRSGTGISARCKQFILGTRRYDTSAVHKAFSEYVPEEAELNTVPRQNVLSFSYSSEKTYFIKVIKPRHRFFHSLITKWRNTITKSIHCGTPFKSYSSAHEMAKYEYEVAQLINQKSDGIATPHEHVQLSNDTDAILYEYSSNIGKIQKEETTLKEFKYIITSIHPIHKEGFTHTNLPDHVIKTLPDGKPEVTDPIGKAKGSQQSLLLVQGYDIASILAQYTSNVGALPAVRIIDEIYETPILVAAHQMASALQATAPGTRPWTIKQLKRTIKEFVDPEKYHEYQELINDSSNDSETDRLEKTTESGSQTTSKSTEPEDMQQLVETDETDETDMEEHQTDSIILGNHTTDGQVSTNSAESVIYSAESSDSDEQIEQDDEETNS